MSPATANDPEIERQVAKYQAERREWIADHGSQQLRDLTLRQPVTSNEAYARERAAVELPLYSFVRRSDVRRIIRKYRSDQMNALLELAGNEGAEPAIIQPELDIPRAERIVREMATEGELLVVEDYLKGAVKRGSSVRGEQVWLAGGYMLARSVSLSHLRERFYRALGQLLAANVEWIDVHDALRDVARIDIDPQRMSYLVEHIIAADADMELPDRCPQVLGERDRLLLRAFALDGITPHRLSHRYEGDLVSQTVEIGQRFIMVADQVSTEHAV
jgi:hypothetical protein